MFPRLPSVDWAEQVTGLRQWTRGSERAPHKPLLLLYALGQFQQHGDAPVVFGEAEEQLGRLLREFGPPRPTSPAYPFHHLVRDGLWTVTTAAGDGSPGPSPAVLRREHAAGRLTPALARDLAGRPQLLPQLARILLDANFEPSLHDDICAAAGLDLEEAETRAPGTPARLPRDPEFRRSILMAYESRCAFCGYDGLLDGFMVGLEAAHVRWHAHGGPSVTANGLCLCSIHHKLFDKGVLGITGQHRIAVSAHFTGRSQVAGLLVLSLAGQEVSQPQKGFPVVAPDHVGWHAREVFRAPARTP
jgi:putative restriction endonuclease